MQCVVYPAGPTPSRGHPSYMCMALKPTAGVLHSKGHLQAELSTLYEKLTRAVECRARLHAWP